MGIFSRRRDTDGQEVFRAMADSAARSLPFQLQVLEAIRGQAIEWDDDGCHFRGTATGKYLGVGAGINAGEAQFILADDSEMWTYPARVATGRFVPSMQPIMDIVMKLLGAELEKHPAAASEKPTGPLPPPGYVPSCRAAEDQRIMDWVVQEFKVLHGVDVSSDKMALQRVKEAAEKAGREIASARQARINLPFLGATADGPAHFESVLTRSKFEELTTDLRPFPAPDELEVESDRQDGAAAVAPQLRPWDSEPAGESADDLGPAVLDRVMTDLQIDEEWCLRRDRTLMWWSHHLLQTVSADPPRISLGDSAVAVRAMIPVVRNVTADEAAVRDTLLILNRTASLGAYIYRPEHRTINHTTTGYFHHGNPNVQRVFILSAILGNWEAHGRAESFAAIVGGEPATSEHPANGARPAPDGMLLIGDEVRRVGEEPSRFAGPVLGTLPESPYLPWMLASGDEDNLTGELPFIHDVPAIAAGMNGLGPGTALVQITTEARHPAYGNGALMVMKLPLDLDEEEASELACGLNRAEAFEWTGFPQLGAWCTGPSSPATVSHVTFLPNYAAVLGLFPLLAFYQSLRCAWAAERLTDPNRSLS